MTIQKKLDTLESLFKNKQYPLLRLKKSDTVPHDTLLVELNSAMAKNTSWRLEINLLPLNKDSNILILQLLVPIIELGETPKKASLFEDIIRINRDLPLGSFGCDERQNLVYFKHNIFIKKEDAMPDNDLFLEIIGMLTFLLENFTLRLHKLLN
jgi:hypothetical protein